VTNKAEIYFSTSAEPIAASAAVQGSEPPPPGAPSKPQYDGTEDIGVETSLCWASGGGEEESEVYVWKEGEGRPGEGEVTPSSCFSPREPLEYATEYRWQVVAVNEFGRTEGPEWSFRTEEEPEPEAPEEPEYLSPADGAELPRPSVVLRWEPSARSEGYAIYLWRASEARPASPAAYRSESAYEALGLAYGESYLWQVEALGSEELDPVPVTSGEVWSFEVLTRPFLRGEVNDDGAIDITDAVFLLGYLFLGGEEPPCLESADADDNGELEITDAIRLLSYLFLGGEAPPPPFADCGPDPTEDDLDCRAFEGCR
jgi:hypothetical protein